MTAASTQTRFETLQGRYRQLEDRLSRLNWALQQKYGSGTAWFVYCSRGETKRRDALRARLDKIIDQIFALVDQAYPHNPLHSGVPYHTVCSLWTWAQVAERCENDPARQPMVRR